MRTNRTKVSPFWLVAAALGVLTTPGLAQVTSIPTTYRLDSSAADTSKPGFIWRMSQVASVGAFTQNSTARAEAQLAGQLGDNLADPNIPGVASGPATAPSPASAPLEFVIPTVINVDIAGGSSGNFTPDDQMPGAPGTAGGNDNQAAEALTWLDLPAGDITMGVNSDDGFRLTIGGGSPVDKISAVQVGVYEGGRGAADSIFKFHIETAGLYAARLVWYNGGGDSRVEWFSQKADGTKVLINDTANGGIKAYRAVSGGGVGYISSVSPVSGATGVQPNATISATIQQGAKDIATTSVELSIDGLKVPAQVTKTGSTITASYTPTALFGSLTTHTAKLSYTDDGAKSGEWSFAIAYVATVPASAKITADTSKPGFVFRVSHVGTIAWRNPVTGSTDVNSNERTDAQLAGLLVDDTGAALKNTADPAAKGVASAAATAANPATAPITFEIPTTINLAETTGQNTGAIPNDGQMPGAPGTDASGDNFAAEIITYLDLPAGLVTFGVNSDDGFRAQLGVDALSTVLLGQYNGGRSGETLFSVNVAEAGVYPFRLTWENGTGPGYLEWYTVQGDKRTLVNDAGGVKAYRAPSGTTPGRVTFVSPIPGMRALNIESSALTILIADGSSAVDEKSVTLTVDDQAVTANATREGSGVRVVYTPTTLQVPFNVHTAVLTFKDAAGAAQTRTWQFRNLKNIVLPAAKVTENFDSTEEGKIPTGWVAENFTDCSGDYCANPAEDLDNLNSDTYKGWVVASRDRLQQLKSRIFNAPIGQVVNGQPVAELASGNLLYAESDVRDGNQVQFITTKPFDLSALKSVVLSFQSLYEQNQDNIGAVEYSVDGGKTWLPVVYYIDSVDSGGDIKLKPDGNVDGVHTLNDANADTASWTDPVTKQTKGDNYGAFILAPVTDALSPYIVGRVNDNNVEGKRVEVYRLYQADSKADVRLRFAQGGTASWYFGVDNIGFYDATASGAAPGGNTPGGGQPTLSLEYSNNTVKLTYTGTLQEATIVTGPYTDVPGATSPYSTPTSGTAKFYRAK